MHKSKYAMGLMCVYLGWVGSHTSICCVFHQASSGSLDLLHSVNSDDRPERRSSMDSKHQRLERKGSGNNLIDQRSIHERTKRSSLER